MYRKTKMQRLDDKKEQILYMIEDGLSQGVIARKMRVSQSYLCKWMQAQDDTETGEEVRETIICTDDNVRAIFAQEYEKYGDEGDYNHLDMSRVTNFYLFFVNYPNFNGSISNWNTSNVTNMGWMFSCTKYFNQPIGDWDTSNVTDMSYMLCGAASFNQTIGNWNVSNVKDFRYIFDNAKSFNQDISKGDIHPDAKTDGMFDGCPIEERYKPKARQRQDDKDHDNIRPSKGYQPKDAKPNNDPDKVWIDEKAMQFFKSKNNSVTQSDGSTADYYKLPEGATELQHLISHKNMNGQIAEIFRTAYRYGAAAHSDRLRDANKIKFYIDAEIERLEKLR